MIQYGECNNHSNEVVQVNHLEPNVLEGYLNLLFLVSHDFQPALPRLDALWNFHAHIKHSGTLRSFHPKPSMPAVSQLLQ